MASDEDSREWKSRANAEYQKVVGAITALSTAALVLPPFFLRDFADIPDGKPLLPHLSAAAFVSWSLLLLCILFAIVFQYTSAKWLKQAYGGKVALSETALEHWLDWSFWLSAGSFIGGLGFLLVFASNLQAAS